MSSEVIATIDLSALRHNFSRVRACSGNRKILSMIKSNAYGHGAVRVAKVLVDSDGFGVATLGEAIALREAGIQQAIVVMSRFNCQNSLPLFAHYRLSAVVHSEEQVVALEKANLSQAIPVWFKLDTGMHRLGALEADLLRLYERLKACPSVQQPIGLMTHLADADNPDSTFTVQQIACFQRETEALSGPKSIVHSAGLLRYPDALADWVRPGIILYGASPFAGRTGEDEDLRPVMTLTARLVAVKPLKKGDRVGYGGTWAAPESMLLGVVAVGYGDGYPRHAPSGTPTLLRDTVCPIVGRVSMDLLTIDCRAVPDAAIGDTVTLWGGGLPIEKVAESAGTISYELMSRITQRVIFNEIN